MNQKKQAKPQMTFWKWLHAHRTKVVLLTFLIVVPIALIFTAYYGAYSSNKRVHFDQSVSGNTEYVTEFVKPDEIDELTLHVTWTALRSPDLNDEDELEGGYYDFNIYYTVNQNFVISNVRVIPVLQTPWADMRSIGGESTLTQSVRQVRVAFNFELPVKPLWFVTVDEANLYLKVSYTVQLQSYNVEKVAYVIYELGDISPKPVVG